MSRRVIAIDGPAASGKSTTARQVAGRLRFVHVNSGLFYRAITWAAQRHGWIGEASRLCKGVAALDIEPEVRDGILSVRVAGQTPGAVLQGREVSRDVSAVSAYGFVRDRVLSLLRATAEVADIVCDGRDIGSVVFPGATLKIFLVADVKERARRRLLDFGGALSDVAIREEAARLEARDRADSTRERAPLRRAADAIEIDTTEMAPGDVVQRIVDLAAERGIEARTG
ncbi:MAG: (d)CMP kinase [Gemmatimonadota bacterium]|jgi:cytidylate kinase|nr:MAG: (d)CMP kinase [Gemmatimonadota bacterium]